MTLLYYLYHDFIVLQVYYYSTLVPLTKLTQLLILCIDKLVDVQQTSIEVDMADLLDGAISRLTKYQSEPVYTLGI